MCPYIVCTHYRDVCVCATADACHHANRNTQHPHSEHKKMLEYHRRDRNESRDMRKVRENRMNIP